jgi:beta-lactamase regulating signal transducer with metallopeptidase domain
MQHLSFERWPDVAWLLTDIAVKGLLLSVLAWVVCLALRRRSAAGRHLVWTLCVSGLVALPLLSVMLPDWRIPVSGALVDLIGSEEPVAGESMPAMSAKPGADERLPAAADRFQSDNAVVTAEAEVSARKIENSSPVAPSSVAQATAEDSGEHTSLGRLMWAWLPWVWVTGVVLALVAPVIGTLQVSLLCRRSQCVTDERWLQLLQQAQRQLSIRRHVRLLCSAQIGMPLTSGAIRPVVILPEGYSEWSGRRRQMVLIHELAHIKRLDWATQMIGQLACAIHWFNPLAWKAVCRMRVEREQACDDIVLSLDVVASDYASELLQIATEPGANTQLNLSAVPMARKSSLEQRVRSILNSACRRGAVSRRVLIAAALLCLAVLVPVAMLRVDSVANADGPTRYPSHVGANGLSSFSLVNDGQVEYCLLYVGDLNSSADYTSNPKTGQWNDQATLQFGDTTVQLSRSDQSPDVLMLNGLPYVLSAGRVLVVDTVNGRPENPVQIHQVDTGIPVVTRENIEQVFEIVHQPVFLPISRVGVAGEFPPGSGQRVEATLYSCHDNYRTRFGLLNVGADGDDSEMEVVQDLSSNDPGDRSWIIDRTLQVKDGTTYRIRCRSDDPDRLTVNGQVFDLTQGRIVSVEEDGRLVQLAKFPRVIGDFDSLQKLYRSLNQPVKVSAAGHLSAVEAPDSQGTPTIVVSQPGQWQIAEGVTLKIDTVRDPEYGDVSRAIVRWSATGELPATQHVVSLASNRHAGWAVGWQRGIPMLWVVARARFQSHSGIRTMDVSSPANIVTWTKYGDDQFDPGLPGGDDPVANAGRTGASIAGVPPRMPGPLRLRLANALDLEVQPGDGLDALIPAGRHVASGQYTETAATQGVWGVNGTVRDADGKPLSGVRVSARTEFHPTIVIASATTDAAGRYRLSFSMNLETLSKFRGLSVAPELSDYFEENNAGDGQFVLMLNDSEDTSRLSAAVEKAGGFKGDPKRVGSGISGVAEPAPRGLRKAVIGTDMTADFVMNRAAVFGGVVTSADGRSLPKAYVAVRLPGQRPGHSVAYGIADDEGRFELREVPVGKALEVLVNPHRKPHQQAVLDQMVVSEPGRYSMTLTWAENADGQADLRVRGLAFLGGQAN